MFGIVTSLIGKRTIKVPNSVPTHTHTHKHTYTHKESMFWEAWNVIKKHNNHGMLNMEKKQNKNQLNVTQRVLCIYLTMLLVPTLSLVAALKTSVRIPPQGNGPFF